MAAIDTSHMNPDQRKAVEVKLRSIRTNLGRHVVEALDDPTVIEIMLNPDGHLWIEYFGRGMVDVGKVLSPTSAESALSAIADLLETVVHQDKPILEGELPLDGSRLEALVRPIVVQPCFAIRKPAKTVFTLEQYYAQGVLSDRTDRLNTKGRAREDFAKRCEGLTHLEIIKLAVRSKMNIFVFGGTGSGKTTFLNAVVDEMAQTDDRLIAIEDTREIQCNARNYVLLRTSEQVGMLSLLRASLRLRPDRIIVGEVRGPEVMALLTAWNTGHPGGIATAHADSEIEGLVRIEQMIEQGGGKANRSVIASVCHMVIFIEKEGELAAGRKVRSVALVTGYDQQQGKYLLHYL